MYEKIKTFINRHKYICAFIVIMVILCTAILFSSRKNILDDGGTIDSVREQLDRIEETKSNIGGTTNAIKDSIGSLENRVKEIENSINGATGTSSRIDDIVGECEIILEQIRNQSTE